MSFVIGFHFRRIICEPVKWHGNDLENWQRPMNRFAKYAKLQENFIFDSLLLRAYLDRQKNTRMSGKKRGKQTQCKCTIFPNVEFRFICTFRLCLHGFCISTECTSVLTAEAEWILYIVLCSVRHVTRTYLHCLLFFHSLLAVLVLLSILWRLCRFSVCLFLFHSVPSISFPFIFF